MPVDDDVHLVLFQDAEVDLAPHGLRRPEEDVAEVRGEHGAGPAVSQRGPQAVQDQVLVIGVDPFVGPMEGFDDFVFHADGNDTEPPPPLHGGLRRPHFGVPDLTLLAVELLQGQLGHLARDLLDAFLLGGDPPLRGELEEAFGALYHVTEGGALRRLQQRVDDVMPVVRVGRRPGRHLADQMPGDDGRRRGAADPPLRPLGEGADPAGAHLADPAADSQLPETAPGFLFVVPVVGRFDARGVGLGEHF